MIFAEHHTGLFVPWRPRATDGLLVVPFDLVDYVPPEPEVVEMRFESNWRIGLWDDAWRRLRIPRDALEAPGSTYAQEMK